MAKTVASLSVSINARTKGLRRGLRNARSQVGQFADQVKSVSKKIAALGAVGAVVATAGTARAINSLSALAKTSDKLSTIEPTALIALRDAAQESGVEVRTFDMGLQRMLRRIQEASQGKGEALGVLKDLRLDAQSLIKLAPEKQFEAIAKAMAAGRDEGLDLSRAMKLFDSEGVALVNTLKLINNQGLGKFIKEVERSGRAVKREQLEPVESVEDRFNRLGNRVAGVFQQLAIIISGPLDNVLRKFEIFLNKPERIKAVADQWRSIAKWIADSDEHLGAFMKSVRGLAAHMARILKAIGIVVGGGAAVIEEKFSNNTARRLENVRRGRDAGAGLGQGPGFDDVIARANEALGPTAGSVAKLVDDATETVKKAAEAVPRVADEAIRKVDEAMQPQGRIFRLERSDGTPINTGGTSLDQLKEQQKTNNHLEELLKKFPARSESVLVAG